MNRSNASRCVIAVLLALPVLPIGGFILDGSPETVFFLGAAAFVTSVLLLGGYSALRTMSIAGSPPASSRFRLTIRDLLCLTTVLFGMLVFMVSAFRCEAAERASRPDPLPAAVFSRFVWELESGLLCMTLGGLIWIRSGLNAAARERYGASRR